MGRALRPRGAQRSRPLVQRPRGGVPPRIVLLLGAPVQILGDRVVGRRLLLGARPRAAG